MEQGKYDLIAFAKHIEHSKTSGHYTKTLGHYTAYTKCDNGGWVHYDCKKNEVPANLPEIGDDDLHKGTLFLYKKAPLRVKACENCSKSKMRCTATNPYDESQCPQCKAKGLKCGLHRVQKPPGRKQGSKNLTRTED